MWIQTPGVPEQGNMYLYWTLAIKRRELKHVDLDPWKASLTIRPRAFQSNHILATVTRNRGCGARLSAFILLLIRLAANSISGPATLTTYHSSTDATFCGPWEGEGMARPFSSMIIRSIAGRVYFCCLWSRSLDTISAPSDVKSVGPECGYRHSARKVILWRVAMLGRLFYFGSQAVRHQVTVVVCGGPDTVEARAIDRRNGSGWFPSTREGWRHFSDINDFIRLNRIAHGWYTEC
jgi:hypothetical protein